MIDCAAAICDAWPEAVVEDVAAGEFAHAVDSLLPSEASELCVYRDLEVARRWQRGDSAGEMRNSMIQVGLCPQGVRLIADDWGDRELADVVTALSRSAVPGLRRQLVEAS